MGAGFVPNRNRVYGTGVARAQQPFSFCGIKSEKRGYAVFIERESRGSFGDTVAEADAERPVDPDPQLTDAALLIVAHLHIPSRPSSARAVSMMAGVISVMPRSLA